MCVQHGGEIPLCAHGVSVCIHVINVYVVQRFPKLKIVVAILVNIAVTEAHQRSRLYTEQWQNWLPLADII